MRHDAVIFERHVQTAQLFFIRFHLFDAFNLKGKVMQTRRVSFKAAFALLPKRDLNGLPIAQEYEAPVVLLRFVHGDKAKHLFVKRERTRKIGHVETNVSQFQFMSTHTAPFLTAFRSF